MEFPGAPIDAATHPEWVAEHMLTTLMPLPLSLSNLLSLLFPWHVWQSCRRFLQ